MDEPAQGLARKIAAALKPHEAVTLSFRNISPASPSDTAAARSAIERELAKLGVDSASQASGMAVQVTLSENLRDAVWVAEIVRGSERSVLIEEHRKPAANAGARPVAIERKFLFEHDRRILDLAPLGRDLLVLDEESVSIYEGAPSGWQRRLSTSIPKPHSWPRDLRGRLLVQGDVYQAYLPGLTCNGTASNGLGIACRDGLLWPVGSGANMLGFAQFAPTRNFFDGRIVAPSGSEKSVPAFFSAAALKVGDTTRWAIEGVDGRAYLYPPANNGVVWEGWGSNIAGIENPCDGRSQVLATSQTDGASADSIGVYDVSGGTPRLAGEIAFPGPVTELWPAAERGAAFAISRDFKSGRYVAFRVAITCAR